MKALYISSYYYPYTSGLTIYAQILAEGMAKRGYEATVLTNRHRAGLKEREVINKVSILRARPLFRLSRGFISPLLFVRFFSEVLKSNIVVLHLPLPEAFIFGPIAKLFRKKVVLIYHANLNLPSWSVSTPFIETLVFLNHLIAGLFASRIVAYSQDYADFAAFLKIFKKKIECIYPPILINEPDAEKVKRQRKQWASFSEVLIGYAGRFAEEKGVDILIKALPEIAKVIPKVKVIFAGEYKNLVYEDFYSRQRRLIDRYRERLIFVGPVDHEEIATFLASLDVFALPSRAECFCIAQVEAMLSGCPVVAFDIPGGRVPVKETGMGKIAGRISSENLANAITEVLGNRDKYIRPRSEIERIFNYRKTFDSYERIFRKP